MTKAWLLGEIALSVPFPIMFARICCPQQIIILIHNFYRNTSSGPMSLPQSLFVWKKQATRYLGLSQTLSGEMSPNSAFCGLEYHKLYGNSIILGQNPSSGYFSPKGRAKYFSRKIYFLDKMYLVKMSQVRLVL